MAKTKLKTINIKGKQYVEVNERLKFFRENYPDHSLNTEVVQLTDDRVVMKATIFNNMGTPLATGHAYEDKASSFINKTSFIENCETSAWGRALSNLGIGIDNSIASAEEVGNAVKNSNKTKITKDIFDAMLKACKDGNGDIVEMRMGKYEMSKAQKDKLNKCIKETPVKLEHKIEKK